MKPTRDRSELARRLLGSRSARTNVTRSGGAFNIGGVDEPFASTKQKTEKALLTLGSIRPRHRYCFLSSREMQYDGENVSNLRDWTVSVSYMRIAAFRYRPATTLSTPPSTARTSPLTY